MASELVLPAGPAPASAALSALRGLSAWQWAALVAACTVAAWIATGTTPKAVLHLWIWAPTLGRGMLANIGISLLAMAIGTLLGLVVGALALSPAKAVRALVRGYVQVFRNVPLLVLIYFTTYVFPFEIRAFGTAVPFPDWLKVVLGLALPASAHVAEIFRGAIQSIPTAQWEAAQSLAFRRAQIFRLIVLPQCVRRMLPPWMNLYASITMSTSLASLVGAHDVVDAAQVASNTVARTDFTILVYGTLLAVFFAYCYPIALATRALERRHERH
jgi:polar amino acid transport system permease protein